MTSKQGLSKKLSDEIQNIIKEFASDKVGVHPTAALIKTLRFDVEDNCTFVIHVRETKNLQITRTLTFFHEQFDERNFPQHFDICLTWDNLRQQDETEAMGNEDSRLYPQGMPDSSMVVVRTQFVTAPF